MNDCAKWEEAEMLKSSNDGAISGHSSGFSLVELLVAVLVLVIIFIGWLRICNFQAIRKESLRRTAIEKGEGYLDFVAMRNLAPTSYSIGFSGGAYTADTTNSTIQPLFATNSTIDEVYPLGYIMEVKRCPETNGWPSGKWAVISLYDQHGVTTNDSAVDPPFSKMSIFME